MNQPLGTTRENPLVLPRKPQPTDHLTLLISGYDLDGYATATLHTHIGPQAAPRAFRVTLRHAILNELVEVRVASTHRDLIEATLIRIITPSPERIAPLCPHFGPRDASHNTNCGGCSLQHLPYPTQLHIKHQNIQRLFTQHKLPTSSILTPLPAPSPWNYRNKMEFSFGDNPSTPLAIGLHPAGFKYDIIATQRCHLLSDWCEHLLPPLARWCLDHNLQPFRSRSNEGFLRQLTLREGKNTNERLVELVTSHHPEARFQDGMIPAEQAASQLAQEIIRLSELADLPITSLYWTQVHVQRGQPTRQIEHLLHGQPHIHEVLRIEEDHHLRFQIHPRAFFQPNTLQAERLYQQVLHAASMPLSEHDSAPPRFRTALDLYCGTGTIALAISKRCDHVLGIELNADAVRNAQQNAADHHIHHAQFFAGDVKDVLQMETFQEAAATLDVVIVDPPRAGLSTQALQHLGSLHAPRIVYVSCNPATLARDIAALHTLHGYTLHHVQPVDMFPHTSHIENVALLTR